MKTTRRSFIEGTIAAAGAAFLPTAVCAAEEDWQTAFTRVGFNPSAPSCTTFIVIGDPHVPWKDKFKDGWRGDMSRHLENRISEWNAMSPRPSALLSTGDQVSTVSGAMGDRWTIKNKAVRERAAADICFLKSYFDRLEIPFYHTVGNHDCYPGEINAEFYASHYSGWKPYERFELGGASDDNVPDTLSYLYK